MSENVETLEQPKKEAKQRLSHVKIMMNSGHTHEYTMSVEKAVQLMQVITYTMHDDNVRRWVDIFDYTEAKSGQMVIDLNSIESVWIDPSE